MGYYMIFLWNFEIYFFFISEFVDVYEKNLEHQDVSVIDCVVGKDGQIYRGRFKPVYIYNFLY